FFSFNFNKSLSAQNKVPTPLPSPSSVPNTDINPLPVASVPPMDILPTGFASPIPLLSQEGAGLAGAVDLDPSASFTSLAPVSGSASESVPILETSGVSVP